MQLDFRTVDLKLAHFWKIARTSGSTTTQVMVVKLTDKNGITGLGEAAPIARYNESLETVAAFLKKVEMPKLSFEHPAESMSYLDTLSPADKSAKCALNIALLDGAARLARKPLYNFLGLGFRENKHISSFTIGIDTSEVVREKVLAAERFPVLKMKVGAPDDKANLQALRDVAPKKTVRVDANEGWRTKEQALEMIEWLARDGHIEFVEQPLPASTPVEDWAWLKQRSPLPIFADESFHSAKDAELAAECFHGVNVKLVKTGGISAGFEALQAARKLGLKTMLGCMIETSILVSAGAHLAELCDFLDLDGNILITNDPYLGATAEKGILSFANATEKFGLRVCAR
jgi:L-alanine-DL-glutamate epimerase-like enolase superfamily enzyme